MLRALLLDRAAHVDPPPCATSATERRAGLFKAPIHRWDSLVIIGRRQEGGWVSLSDMSVLVLPVCRLSEVPGNLCVLKIRRRCWGFWVRRLAGWPRHRA
jgi:hypothetical protein